MQALHLHDQDFPPELYSPQVNYIITLTKTYIYIPICHDIILTKHLLKY